MTKNNKITLESENWLKNRVKSTFQVTIVTIFAILVVEAVSFGTLFETLSNPVLGLFGLEIGLTPSILGVGTLWGIASGGLAYIIAELFRDMLLGLQEYLPKQINELVTVTRAKLLINLIIAIIVVPFTIIILTAVAATQFDTVEVLWEVLTVGYSGAIIGAYSEIISNVVSDS